MENDGARRQRVDNLFVRDLLAEGYDKGVGVLTALGVYLVEILWGQQKDTAIRQRLLLSVETADAAAAFIIYHLIVIMPMLFRPGMVFFLMDMYVLASEHIPLKLVDGAVHFDLLTLPPILAILYVIFYILSY